MLIIIGLLFRNKAVQNNFPDSTDKFSPGNSLILCEGVTDCGS